MVSILEDIRLSLGLMHLLSKTLEKLTVIMEVWERAGSCRYLEKDRAMLVWSYVAPMIITNVSLP